MYEKLFEQFIEEQEEAGNFGGHVGPEVRRHIMYFVEWLEADQLQLERTDCHHCKMAADKNNQSVTACPFH